MKRLPRFRLREQERKEALVHEELGLPLPDGTEAFMYEKRLKTYMMPLSCLFGVHVILASAKRERREKRGGPEPGPPRARQATQRPRISATVFGVW